MSVTNSSTEDLPEHVTFEILSRLLVKTIIHCKCVCKKWLDLVSCSYFANLHFSRSPSGIFMHHDPLKEKTRYNPGKLMWLDIEDELRHLDRLHYRDLMSLDLNLSPKTEILSPKTEILPVGSVGGLLCLWMWKYGEETASIYISNPITREYINIPLPVPGQSTFRPSEGTLARCFGVGLLTHEYKVVRVFDYENIKLTDSVFEAQVYTLGTGQGQWKSLGLIPYFLLGDSGKFLNDHAHWIVSDEDSPRKLCAFDFDKETFKLFPPPPVKDIQETERHHRSLGVLKGYLCQCDTFDSQFTIWMMKEYGVEKSWELQVIIKRSISPDIFSVKQPPVKPVELLNDGTFLVFFKRRKFVGFSQHTGTIVATKYYNPFAKGLVYRPSFLKLPQL